MARAELEPLVETYPQVYEIRELACTLDTRTGVEDSEHCAHLEPLEGEGR